MITFAKTVKWFLFILLLGSGAAGSYGWYLWQHTDELLHQRLIAKIQEIAPDWKVEIGRTRFDLQGRIRIFDVKLKAADGHSSLLDAPEMMLVVDREQIAEANPCVHQIRLVRPQFHLVRSPQGKWNWEGLSPPKLSNAVSEWQIEQASVTLLVHGTGKGEPVSTVLRNLDIQFIPAGKRQFRFNCSTKFELADKVSLEGEWNLNAGSWTLGGEVPGLKVGANLLELAGGLSATVGKTIAQASGFAAAHLTGPRLSHRSSAAPAPPAPALRFAGLGVTALADVRFRCSQWKPGADLEYNVATTIKQGELTHALLPYALHELRGSLLLDNRKLTIRQLSARNGITAAAVDGEVVHQGELHPARLTINVEDLILEERLRGCLPESRQKIYDSLQPTGKVELNLRLTYNDRDGWERESDLVARGCTVTHVRFPYQVEEVTGTIKQRGDLLDIAMRGVAGQRPVTLLGRVRNPGPDAEAVFEIDVTALPVDGTLRAACPAALQLTLDALRVQGVADGHVRISRPAGPDQKFTPVIRVQLRDCSANCRPFPYALTGLTGTVEGIGFDDWTFRNLKAQHEGADIQGHGTFRRNENGRGQLVLDLEATGAAFDQQLQSAVPEQWQPVWKEFAPTGRLNATAHVEWTPGAPPAVQLNARMIDAGFCMKSFPYALEDVEAQVSLGVGKLAILSLSGRHEETRVRMTGVGTFAPDGNWRIRLNDLYVDDLNPDRRFRKTLPPRLREIIETLDPRGKLSLSGTLEFAGTGRPRDAVTAAWNLLTVYSGATLTTGVDLDNLHGRVTLNGTWDGERVNGNGQIDLDSVSIKGHQLTDVKGPVRVDGTHLVLGSIDQVNRSSLEKGQPTDSSHRVTAHFIDGILSLDGAAVLEKETSYHVRLELAGGRLERYAQLYMKRRYRLMGMINGSVDFDGRGASAQRLKGRGQVVVSPAALYELPVIVSIFKILNFAPPDKTAFRQARVVFDIGGGQLQLRLAELNGDAITLRGRGYIPFEGPMNLDFYSSAARSQIPLPIVGPLIGATTEGWVGVQVRGTMSDPVATVRALPQMDDALRAFLGSFDARPIPAGQRGAREARAPRR